MKRINIRRVKSTKEERTIEDALIRGDYVPVSKEEHIRIAAALVARKKNAVLHIRINQMDLERLKKKARKLGVKYQTFISELLHRIAHS